MNIGNAKNGFKPPQPYVSLLLGNTDPITETAIVCAYLVVKGIATQEELRQLADKIYASRNGAAKCVDIAEMCRKVQEMEGDENVV